MPQVLALFKKAGDRLAKAIGRVLDLMFVPNLKIPFKKYELWSNPGFMPRPSGIDCVVCMSQAE